MNNNKFVLKLYGFATIFLLFGIVLYFGLLLIYNFNTILLSGLIYLAVIPVSIVHYFKIKNRFKIQVTDTEDDEDIL